MDAPATTFYRIQRKKLLHWDDIAYPPCILDEALKVFEFFKAIENTKRYKRPIRLIKKTVEILKEHDYE